MIIERSNPNKGASQDGDPKGAQSQNPVVQAEVAKLDAPAQAAPVAPATPAPATPDANQLMSLVAALLEQSKIASAREARLAKSEEDEYNRIENRRQQYARNRSGADQAMIDRQKACKHLKGGAFRMKTAAKDYAVYLHRFIDNTQYVKCFLCKMKWYLTDTQERIVRGGKVLVNHTGIGWREALQMMDDSTNKPSSSEIPSSAWSKVQAENEIPDTGSVHTL